MGVQKGVIKKFFTGFIASAVLGCAFAGSAAAEDKSFTIGTDQGLTTKYLWRATTVGSSNTAGIIRDDHGTAWQGDVYLTLFDMLTFNVWYDVPLGQKAKSLGTGSQGSAFEVDYTVDLAYSLDKWSFNFGHILYTFPTTAAGSISQTSEVYVTASYDMLLSPTLGVYYDYDNVNGVYLQFDVSHSVELNDWATLNLGATVGYASGEGIDTRKDANGQQYFQYYEQNSGITNGVFSASVDFALGHVSPMLDKFTLSPSFAWDVRNTSMILGSKTNAPSYAAQETVAAINLNFEY